MAKITLVFEDKPDGSGVTVQCDPPFDVLVQQQTDSVAACYAKVALISVNERSKKVQRKAPTVRRQSLRATLTDVPRSDAHLGAVGD